MTMADTVAVMNKGRIEQLGSPEALYELPKTAFVANFLGQSNMLPAVVTSTSGGVIVAQTDAGKVSVPADRATRTSGEITIGVRPEKLILHTSAPEPTPGTNVLGPGRVIDVSFTGVSTQYLIHIPGIGELGLFAQNMVVGPVVGVGAEVWVHWAIEHGFGLEAGAREESTLDESAPTSAGALLQDAG